MSDENKEATTEVAVAEEQQYKPLSTALKFFYGVGDFGFNLMSSVETYYFVFFLTNFAFVDLGPVESAAFAASVAGIGSTVDAILGWMYGGFINSLKPFKWGRYRSWLVVLPWIVPFLYCFEFTAITDNVMINAALIVFFNVTSHAAWDFPYVSNIAMISMAAHTPEDRARMASTRGMWSNASKIFFGYLFPIVALAGAGMFGEQNQYAFGALVMGIAFAVLYFVHFKMFKGYEKEYTKEELANYKKTSDQGKTTFRDLGRALVTNQPLVFLLLADIAKWIFNFMCAGIAAYYFNYVALGMAPVGLGILGVLAMLGVYQMLSNLLCVIGAALSANFAKAIGSTRNAMIFALLFMAAMMFIAYFLYYNVWMVVIFMSLAQFGYGITYSCSTAMYADTVVYNEWKNKTNAAGWINGLQLFPLKIGFMARSIIIPFVLAFVGLNAKGYQPVLDFVAGKVDGVVDPTKVLDVAGAQDVLANPTAYGFDPELINQFLSFQHGIGIGFMIIPACLCILGAVLLAFGYKLTNEKMAQYQAEIDARKAAGE